MKRLTIFVMVASIAGAFAVGAAAQRSGGDKVRGAQIYKASCGSCHSIDANRVGPAHRGVVGRRAGTAKGYSYSSAMRRSRIVWTPDTLDRFLRDPQKMIPGTKMGFRIGDPARRADVIAYLEQYRTGKDR